ncbi:hypothetical protein K435DRAFT_807219 [Dendrothele bispora CBS 962.96]|uniref:Uncharacterized protein n=1 Tax=Dendrothele bispora (strain CBS 962.96) TaxID=1314807 RepID=A0A4S8L5U7_DENBC|nr:hypothetical protein K435DRAFT_807219 [Dendrothele bispora CBS 962.96]
MSSEAQPGSLDTIRGRGRGRGRGKSRGGLGKYLRARGRGSGRGYSGIKEEEPELDEDGEPIVEPEVDLTAFLERQRISDGPGPSSTLKGDADVDVDYSVAQFSTKPAVDLKHRFREKSENLRRKPVVNVPARERKQEASYVDAPLFQYQRMPNQKPKWKKWKTFWTNC